MDAACGAQSRETYPYKIAVLCDLRDPDGRVLLLHRVKEPNKGLHSPIGGKLDMALGESPAQCARREIQEEAGIDVPIERLHLGGMISERGYEGQTNWLLFWYRVLGPVDVSPQTIREGVLAWHEWREIEAGMRGEPGGLLLPETDRRIIWPLVSEHEGGFFAVHIDCTDAPNDHMAASAGGLKWRVECSEKRRSWERPSP